MEKERLERFLGAVKTQRKNLAPQLYKQKITMAVDSRESMRNLTLVIGALATVSVAALSYALPQIHILVLIGTIILLLDVVMIVAYLTYVARLDTNSLMDRKLNLLDPLDEVMELYEKLGNKEITDEQFDKQSEVQIGIYNKGKEREESKKTTDSHFRSSHWDIWFTVMLSIGIILISIGLILPLAENGKYNSTSSISIPVNTTTTIIISHG